MLSSYYCARSMRFIKQEEKPFGANQNRISIFTIIKVLHFPIELWLGISTQILLCN